ncbi:RHS repeat-associated core domain-containing protein [Actimicrobium sp. CCI2.3]|uniref:RHS repeat-associated core domain-containing protein n=1 Tax=Actimicrobium sp. CCI2.3 TaxID=3048616 RepID=UPI002AB51DCA|nr:RHS repeat-associated core domain-containing protein [Actimicrobium sp. CCI2.3]MDY7573183.1 RHS repeat-associated core domain-containing protein [Actimicrobium sp. CCI2.3]MEB0022162.1 RHS repeat-associated core domain-containing protein [Actimicrobium sp. CCI2.3]
MKRITAILLLLCVVFSGAVHAAPASPQCTNLAGTTGDPGTGCAGNPINLTTGNKFQREVDMPALPGVLGLELVRYYNSDFSSPRIPNGILGRGWKLSYETELYVAGKTLQIILADGTHLTFSRDPLDPSRCSTGNPAHGTVVIRRGARGNDYLWTQVDGRQLTFTARGRLEMIRVPGGQFVSMTHDDDGLLQTVTDPQGRQLRLGYPDRQTLRKDGRRFRGVQTIVSPVGTFAYGYGSALPAGATVDPSVTLANLTGVTGPDHQRFYHYEDPQHPTLLTGISIGGERFSTYAYNADGKAILSTHASDVDKVTLDYRSSTETVLTNSLGQVTTYRHAVVGDRHQVLEVRGPGCRLCSEGNVRYATNALGQLTETTRLNAAGQPLSGVRLTLDHVGRTLAIDRIFYVNGQPQPAQRQARFQYHSDSGFGPTLVARPSVVPGQEVVTQLRYNAAGQPLAVTETGWEPGSPATAISRTTSYRYTTINGSSLLTTIDGPLPNGPTGSPADSDVTQLRYDARGDFLIETIAPGNRRTTLQNAATGYPDQVTVSDGFHRPVVTSFARNARGQLTRLTQFLHPAPQRWFDAAVSPVALVTQISYNAAGLPQRLIRPDGSWIDALQDAAGRQRGLRDQDGNTASEVSDTESQLLQTRLHTTATDIVSSYRYDDQHRLAQLTDPAQAVTQFAYDTVTGQLASHTDALGRRTAYQVDAAGRIAAVLQNAEGSTPAVTRPGYLPGTSLVDRLTDANGATTQRIVDDFGRTVRVDSPDSGIRTARYDAADQLILRIDANGNPTRYQYDAAGRLILQVSTGSAGVVRTEYRYRGDRLIEIAHPQQSTRFQHDDNGRVTGRTDWLTREGAAPLRFSTSYHYDSLNRLDRATLPSGETLALTFDHASRPQRLDLVSADGRRTRALVTGIGLNPFTGLTGFTHGNGVMTRYQSAPATGQRTGVTVAGTHPLYAQQVRYDRVGRITGITRSTRSTPGEAIQDDERYGYDALDRLSRVGTPHENVSWTYDTVGNRLTGADRQTLAYQPASNRLASIRDGDRNTRYAYDAAGNPLTIGLQHLRYDVTGRLRDVGTATGPVARYAYNATGERVSKTTFDAHGKARTTYFLYQGNQLASEIDDSGRVTTHFVYLNQMPVAQLAYAPAPTGVLPTLRGWIGWHDEATDSQLYALHTDHLGIPQLATDERQQVVWKARYSAFGQATITTQKITLNLRLPGHYADAETGRHYNMFRDYDPATGRYLQSDPIGLDGGFNTYGYVNGNPLGAIDPLGLAAQCPASCTPAQSSAALRELSRQARVDGDVDAAYSYLRRALDVQNAVAACTLQGTAAGMSDEDAAILGGMVLNPSGTTPVGMAGSAGGGERRNGGITNGVASRLKSVGATEYEPTGFLGKSGFEMKNAPWQKVRNEPAVIGNRKFSGHALDQMQNRGLMPSVIENALTNGITFPTRVGTTGFYDATNNVRVIINSGTGRVVTAIKGAP